MREEVSQDCWGVWTQVMLREPTSVGCEAGCWWQCGGGWDGGDGRGPATLEAHTEAVTGWREEESVQLFRGRISKLWWLREEGKRIGKASVNEGGFQLERLGGLFNWDPDISEFEIYKQLLVVLIKCECFLTRVLAKKCLDKICFSLNCILWCSELIWLDVRKWRNAFLLKFFIPLFVALVQTL